MAQDRALLPLPTPAKPTLLSEIKACCSSPIFLCIVFAYAAYTAVLIALSTFGASFVMALGIFDKETTAATIFGGLICIAGIVGTPIGGYIIDRLPSDQVRQRRMR